MRLPMFRIDAFIPVRDFRFENYDGPVNSEEITPRHASLTCRNHPSARYSTKNPYQRSLHVLRGPDEHPFRECECPFADLVVIVSECQWPCVKVTR